MPEFTRRSTDTTQIHQSEIDELILQEDDKRQRAYLVLLNNINQSLIANTSLTQQNTMMLQDHIEDYQDHKDSYERHTQSEALMVSEIKGAKRVLVYVFGAIQMIVVASVGWLITDLKDVHAHLAAVTVSDTATEIRMSELERIERLEHR
jgi:hypothetical protein